MLEAVQILYVDTPPSPPPSCRCTSCCLLNPPCCSLLTCPPPLTPSRSVASLTHGDELEAVRRLKVGASPSHRISKEEQEEQNLVKLQHEARMKEVGETRRAQRGAGRAGGAEQMNVEDGGREEGRGRGGEREGSRGEEEEEEEGL
eukprot:760835-Hanusia_phi.AAC.4